MSRTAISRSLICCHLERKNDALICCSRTCIGDIPLQKINPILFQIQFTSDNFNFSLTSVSANNIMHFKMLTNVCLVVQMIFTRWWQVYIFLRMWQHYGNAGVVQYLVAVCNTTKNALTCPSWPMC